MRVVVAEDQALLREGLVALLREHGVEVVAQAEDGPGLLRIIGGHKPDLAIVDVRLPPTFTDEGIRAAIEARERHPGLGILILSQYVEPVYTAELLASGGAPTPRSRGRWSSRRAPSRSTSRTSSASSICRTPTTTTVGCSRC